MESRSVKNRRKLQLTPKTSTTTATGIQNQATDWNNLSFLSKVESVFDELIGIFRAKNVDYGDSINTKPMFAKNVSVEESIKIRLGDKIFRLQTLFNSEECAQVKDESIDDTLKDAINYMTALLIARKNAKQI